MIKINDYISYIEKSRDPLSAEVFVIQGKKNVYIYDVGNGEKYVDMINRQISDKIVVLSHFHPDHIYNLNQINYQKLYQSKNTSKYTKINGYISEEIKTDDEIKIIEIPSTHAKGCLALEFGDYLFVGDSFYASNKRLYNANFLKMQIDYLKTSKVQYVIMSHREPLVESKEVILKELIEIYNKRNPKEPFISL